MPSRPLVIRPWRPKRKMRERESTKGRGNDGQGGDEVEKLFPFHLCTRHGKSKDVTQESGNNGNNGPELQAVEKGLSVTAVHEHFTVAFQGEGAVVIGHAELEDVEYRQKDKEKNGDKDGKNHHHQQRLT